MDQKQVGEFIARRRKELKMTQKELAQKLGVTDRAVSKWENGRCMPDLSLFQPLSRSLKVGVNDLLSGEIIPEKQYRRKSVENIISLALILAYSTFTFYHRCRTIKRKFVSVLITVFGAAGTFLSFVAFIGRTW